MVKVFNPLLDSKPTSKGIPVEPVRIEAGVKEARSPISGKPMRKVLCDNVEGWWDAENRVVLPVMED